MLKGFKEWWKSKTNYAIIAGFLISGLSAVLGNTHWVVVALIAVCSGLGIYGRGTAEKMIK